MLMFLAKNVPHLTAFIHDFSKGIEGIDGYFTYILYFGILMQHVTISWIGSLLALGPYEP